MSVLYFATSMEFWNSLCLQDTCDQTKSAPHCMPFQNCQEAVSFAGADSNSVAMFLSSNHSSLVTQSNRAIRCPFWGFWFCGQICFGEALEQRSSDILSAKIAGPLLPGAPFVFGRGHRCSPTSIGYLDSLVQRWARPDREVLHPSALFFGLAGRT